MTLLDHASPVDRRAEAQDRKRRQILDAAAKVFRGLGYDGASMNDVAAEAGVSKPTLYSYFQSKDGLFEAIVDDLRANRPEKIVGLDPADPDIAGQLTRYGRALARLILAPENIAVLRMVMGAAERFPAVGERFFATGPALGHRRVKAYLEAKVADGALTVADTDTAAWHFIDLIQSPHGRFALMGLVHRPAPEELDRSVARAVSMFLDGFRADPSAPGVQ